MKDQTQPEALHLATILDCYGWPDTDKAANELRRLSCQLSFMDSELARLKAENELLQRTLAMRAIHGEDESLARIEARLEGLSNEVSKIGSLQQEPQGEVVVTQTESGQIVLVSRQNDEGQILSVIAEDEVRRVPCPIAQLVPLTKAQMLDAIRHAWLKPNCSLEDIGRAIEAAHGIK